MIRLAQTGADRFFNDNGEGYWDAPTLRREQWHFAVKRAGKYRVTVSYPAGKFSRLLDVAVGEQVLKASLHGDEKGPSDAGVVELPASEDILLAVTPATPRERGAKLDVALGQVVLTPQ